MSDATDSWSLCLTPARVGVRARIGAAGAAADFPAAAASQAAAGPRAAAARQGAGDAFYARGSRSGFGRHCRSGEANLRTDRLRARALFFRLCLYPDPVGECAGAAFALAADLFHTMERAKDFSGAACR